MKKKWYFILVCLSLLVCPIVFSYGYNGQIEITRDESSIISSNLVNNYVPYVGAIKNVDLNNKNFTTIGIAYIGKDWKAIIGIDDDFAGYFETPTTKSAFGYKNGTGKTWGAWIAGDMQLYGFLNVTDNITTERIKTNGWGSEFGNDTIQYWKVEELNLGAFGVYPMWSAYSDGTFGNVGAIADNLIIFDKVNSGQPSLTFSANDVSNVGAIQYFPATSTFIITNTIGNPYANLIVNGGIAGNNGSLYKLNIGVNSLTNPRSQELMVQGSANISGNLYVNETLFSIDSNLNRITSKQGGIFLYQNSIPTVISGQQGQLMVSSDGSANRGIRIIQSSNNANTPILFFQKSRGNESTPTSVNNTDFTGAFFFQAYNGTGYIQQASIGTVINQTNIQANNISMDIVFSTSNTRPITTVTSDEKMRLTSLGWLGIGTASPTQLLDVNGNANFNGNVTMNDYATINNTWYFVIGNGSGSAQSVGRFGIGVSSPEFQVEIVNERAAATGGTDRHLVLSQNVNAPAGAQITSQRSRGNHSSPTIVNNNDIGFNFINSVWNGSTYIYTNFMSWTINSSVINGTNIASDFYLTSNPKGSSTGTDGELFRVKGESGYFGIGTRSPTTRLDVAGSTIVRGDLNVTQNLYVSGNSTITITHSGMFTSSENGVGGATLNGTYKAVNFTDSVHGGDGFSFNGTALQLTDPQQSGEYQVQWHTQKDGTQNHIYFGKIFVNDVEQNNTMDRGVGQASNALRMQGIGFINISYGDNVTLRMKDISVGGSTPLVYIKNVNIWRVGRPH